jgi:hypothetical protein
MIKIPNNDQRIDIVSSFKDFFFMQPNGSSMCVHGYRVHTLLIMMSREIWFSPSKNLSSHCFSAEFSTTFSLEGKRVTHTFQAFDDGLASTSENPDVDVDHHFHQGGVQAVLS